MPKSFSDKLAHVTGGRRYCFVVMTYHGSYAFFERIRSTVAEATGLECIRADDIPGVGEDLRNKIHSAIDSAAFVIADVSYPRPNIYYEVGYSIARDKAILLLAEQSVTIPTDLLGVELIRYVDSREGWPKFELEFRKQLALHGDSHVSLLRAMIIPANPSPSYILASPAGRRASLRFRSPHERRTYGDNLGVVGILGAFGSVYGEHVVPELLNAASAPDDLIDRDANFYLIGSPKVNRFVGLFLDEMQRGQSPNWRFHLAPGETEEGACEMLLSGEPESGAFQSPPPPWDAPYKDYGLILRGPNPRHPERMATILAGPHSLGTGAACLAATNSRLIREISGRFPDAVGLANREETIWVLVKGVAGADLHFSSEDVTIDSAGTVDFARGTTGA